MFVRLLLVAARAWIAACAAFEPLEGFLLRHIAYWVVAIVASGLVFAAEASAMSADSSRLADNQTRANASNSHVHVNANDCAPSHPSAVWDSHNNLVGYECDDNAQGQ